jgi:hypothetical protein
MQLVTVLKDKDKKRNSKLRGKIIGVLAAIIVESKCGSVMASERGKMASSPSQPPLLEAPLEFLKHSWLTANKSDKASKPTECRAKIGTMCD